MPYTYTGNLTGSATTGENAVNASTSTANEDAIYGSSTVSSANGVTGVNSAAGASATGVYGSATAATAGTYGVWGQNASTTGCGVYGNSTATTGACYGVYGGSASSSGYAVYGTATSASGSCYGVYGTCASSGGYGVYAANTSTGAALYATSSTTSGSSGTCAITNTNGGNAIYVNSTGWAINAQSTGTTGGGVGVYGSSASAAGYGVYASNATNGGVALQAVSGTSGTAFIAKGGPGAITASTTNTSGGATCVTVNSSSTNSSNTGITVTAGNAVTGASNNVALMANTFGTTANGCYAANFGGYITKSGTAFTIDHPLDPANKYLRHGGVESPEAKNIYDGVGVADNNGDLIVQMPTYFEALNADMRYQLTPLGGAAPDLHIKEELRAGRFVVGGAKPGQRISWQVTGKRIDAFALANPIIVEEDKGPMRGLYRHPDLFDQPADKSIFRAMAKYTPGTDTNGLAPAETLHGAPRSTVPLPVS